MTGEASLKNSETFFVTAIYAKMLEMARGLIVHEVLIENGKVRLAADVLLPEKTKVYVVIPDFDQTENRPKFDLNEMLARTPADYQPQEEDFGKPVGKEKW